jgi:hypothetical protein
MTMAYTKAQREAKKTETNNIKSEEKNVVGIKEESKNVAKKIKLDDNVSLLVSSNVFGILTYVNHKTGDIYRWNNMGEVQSLYVSDIRAMKSNQRRFLEENWILIEGIADKDEVYDDVNIEDVYEALQISHYYSETLCPKNLNDIFNWSAADIKLKVPKMTQTVKESLIVRANELIKQGILDSIAKVKALEEVLDCELTSPED